MNEDDRPLMVTIQCITYNHEPYIRQCLEGFVMQKTNFRFEAIVHDDASTDGTAAIVKEYAEKYPDIIKPIFETENQYSKHDGSLERIMNEHTHGKYVALCEGDDYWIDPLKLQKQVDCMEAHTEYGMCYTKAIILREGKEAGEFGTDDVSFEGLISYSNFPTLTRLFRASLYANYIQEVKPETRKWLMGDYPFAFFCVLKSKVMFINEVSAVYRVLENSASHSTDIDYLLKFYDSADDVRYFFVNNYIKSKSQIDKITTQIKQNEVNYKIGLLLKNCSFDRAIEIYKKERNYILCKNKIFCFMAAYIPSFVKLLMSFKQDLHKAFNCCIFN